MTTEKLMVEYDNSIEILNQFSSSMQSLVSRLMNASSITAHSISARVKSRNSLQTKATKKSKYSLLSEVTDIVGIRIITHYSDEVDQIADLIEKEFTVDTDNSIDKRASLDPDRFGYLSLHYVVSLSSSRSKLIEYEKFSSMKFEIQIRSILQHTWAEIEHDIGYKSKIEIPKPVRRKFSQLAGLLEMADDQFIQIRNELKVYEDDVADIIVQAPNDVGIDNVTIHNYIRTSKLIAKIESGFTNSFNMKLYEQPVWNLSRYVKYCNYFSIETIHQLDEEMANYEVHINQRASEVINPTNTLPVGSSILFFFQVLASKLESKKAIMKFLDEMDVETKAKRSAFASYLYTFGERQGLRTN
ncbi:hypothetical protein N473_04620 [Pseudoalteromonas luteoviolacea CPMOR-1]|uniref:RelA/SpoT domain-containing protein n=1 Tax=Pseudoalteromonas luteoviolacea CPMOR-1 TaxID=1365248 RepID=A0A167HZV2_9GAMM|nr:hypothetical protein [Pseudoalteromonas luteoviolacea]KZN58723.1 hypothetical protein N473_04620 [Pseudoalteromonas luteoviolacea CPMOR-1]